MSSNAALNQCANLLAGKEDTSSDLFMSYKGIVSNTFLSFFPHSPLELTRIKFHKSSATDQRPKTGFQTKDPRLDFMTHFLHSLMYSKDKELLAVKTLKSLCRLHLLLKSPLFREVSKLHIALKVHLIDTLIFSAMSF